MSVSESPKLTMDSKHREDDLLIADEDEDASKIKRTVNANVIIDDEGEVKKRLLFTFT